MYWAYDLVGKSSAVIRFTPSSGMPRKRLVNHCNCNLMPKTAARLGKMGLDDAQGHVTCVTEHEKYALGATKPGGYAHNGFHGSGDSNKAQKGPQEADGLQFLSQQPPWRCHVCNVSCTSRETLLGHAAGQKHKRKARAAVAAAAGSKPLPADTPSTPAPAEATGRDENGDVHVALANASVKQPRKGQLNQGQASENPDGLEGTARQGSTQGLGRKHKWKKLAAELLRARGGSMKIKKLQKTLLAQAGLPRTDDEAAKQMLSKWSKSPKFDILEDGVVALT